MVAIEEAIAQSRAQDKAGDIAADERARRLEPKLIYHDLAARARSNLQIPNVRVLTKSAIESDFPHADVMYVFAGATHPPSSWLDALSIGGRLVFPLTPNAGLGCLPLVTRAGETEYAAASLASVAFIPCIGARDVSTSDSL